MLLFVECFPAFSSHHPHQRLQSSQWPCEKAGIIGVPILKSGHSVSPIEQALLIGRVEQKQVYSCEYAKHSLFYFIFLSSGKDMFLLTLEREEGGERETSLWGRNINRLPPLHTPTRNWTRNLNVYRTMLQLPEPPSQGNTVCSCFIVIFPCEQLTNLLLPHPVCVCLCASFFFILSSSFPLFLFSPSCFLFVCFITRFTTKHKGGPFGCCFPLTWAGWERN